MVIANDLTVFEDKFDRADADLDGDNGWKVIGSGVGETEIFQTYVTQKVAGEETLSLQETTKLKTTSQEVRAQVFSSANESGGGDIQAVGIGLNGEVESGLPKDWGVIAYLRYKQDGTRTIDVGVHLALAQWLTLGVKALASKTVTLLKDDTGSDLNMLQDLMLRIDKRQGGTRIRAYLNNDDYGKPDLEYEWNQDILTVKSAYIYFAASLAIRTIAATSFVARDIEDNFETLERPDAYTVGYVLDQAKLRYKSERNPGDSDLSVDLAISFVRQAQAELVHRCGDMAYFLNEAELMNLQADSNNIVKMPFRVNRILGFQQDDDGEESPVSFKLIRRAPDGRLEIKMNPSVSPGRLYRVYYVKRWEDIDRDSDQVVIPKHHTEALILGVCRRYAEYDGAAATEQMIAVSAERQTLLLLRECNKQRRMKGDRLYPVRNRDGLSRYESQTLYHYGY